jgi:hypothetical protein
MQPCDLPRPVVRPCYNYQHCDDNELKKVKIFEATKLIQKGAITRSGNQEPKLSLKMLYSDGTWQDKLAGLKSEKACAPAREKKNHAYITM